MECILFTASLGKRQKKEMQGKAFRRIGRDRPLRVIDRSEAAVISVFWAELWQVQ